MDLKRHCALTILVIVVASALYLCAAGIVVAGSNYAELAVAPALPVNAMVLLLSYLNWNIRKKRSA